MALAFLMGAAMAVLGGCPAEKDEPPPDTGTGGGGGAGGMATTCGDGKLDMGEACDDGNNSPADGCTACVVDDCFTCTADAGMLSTCMAKAAGDMCQSTKVCDAMGACVECIDDTQCSGGGYCFASTCAKCDDATKNGDETDADCGGMHCGKCAVAKTCAVADDCESTFCADGVCCNEACDGACLACDLAGFVGECSFIEKFGEDPSYGMGMACLAAEGEACSAAGACGKAIGQACAGNSECASTRCGMGMPKICVGLTGDPCLQNTDCFSNTCTNNVCM